MDFKIMNTVAAMPSRQTAYKLWIAEIVHADYMPGEGEWDPNYLDVKGLKVTRVNMLGVVTNIFSHPNNDYGSVLIEDGTEAIAIRTFKEDTKQLADYHIGDTIMVIGRPRQYQNEIYIIPEILKKVDNPAWLKLRKVELAQTRGTITIQQPQKKIIHEEREQREEHIALDAQKSGTETTRQKILNTLEKQGDAGMDIDVLIQQVSADEGEAEKMIEDLIKEGEIYMARPGVLKII